MYTQKIDAHNRIKVLTTVLFAEMDVGNINEELKLDSFVCFCRRWKKGTDSRISNKASKFQFAIVCLLNFSVIIVSFLVCISSFLSTSLCHLKISTYHYFLLYIFRNNFESFLCVYLYIFFFWKKAPGKQ